MYQRTLDTQVNADKAEPHELGEQVLTFTRNKTSSSAPLDIGCADGHHIVNWEWTDS